MSEFVQTAAVTVIAIGAAVFVLRPYFGRKRSGGDPPVCPKCGTVGGRCETSPSTSPTGTAPVSRP